MVSPAPDRVAQPVLPDLPVLQSAHLCHLWRGSQRPGHLSGVCQLHLLPPELLYPARGLWVCSSFHSVWSWNKHVPVDQLHHSGGYTWTPGHALGLCLSGRSWRRRPWPQEREAAVPEQGEVPPATAPVADPQLWPQLSALDMAPRQALTNHSTGLSSVQPIRSVFIIPRLLMFRSLVMHIKLNIVFLFIWLARGIHVSA